MSHVIDLYRNNNQVIIDAFDQIVVGIFMEKQRYQHKSFVICGCNPGAGTTSTSVELAISLSVSGWRTVLVDADLRKDGRYKRLNQKADAGLSDYITRDCTAQSICNGTNWPGLDYIACGKSSEETPVKLLCSVRMGELLEYLNETYDFIIFDVPSLNSAVDAKIMGSKVDCAFLVVEADKTTFKNLSEAQHSMEEVGANVAGVIVNKVSLEEYEKVVRDYNYFNDKVFISQNRYYGSGEEKKKKSGISRIASRIRRLMGCLFIVGALSGMVFGTPVQAAQASGALVWNAPEQEDYSMLPILMVTGYEVERGTVAAGSKFTLRVDFQNLNRYVSANQVYITIYSNTEGVYLQHGETNQRYLEYLGAGGTGSLTVDMAVSEAVQSDSALMEIRFDYVNSTGKSGTNTTSISPDIKKSSKLEILSMTASDSATVGSKALFNIRYANTGETEIKNIHMRLEGNIENSDKEIVLDVPEPGRQKYLDKYVVFTEPGNQRITVGISYEDEEGNFYELEEQRISVMVRRRSSDESGPQIEDETAAEVVVETGMTSVLLRLQKKLKDAGINVTQSQLRGGAAGLVGIAAFLGVLFLWFVPGKRRRNGSRGNRESRERRESRQKGVCLISLKEPKKGGKK